MTVSFRTTGPPVGEDAVASFEAGLPAPLPDDYRTFLQTQNGGWAPSCWWPPEVGGADFVTAAFYSLGVVANAESLTLTREIFDERIPRDLLAVGGDANGNQLCLSLADENRGSIWFYDHELETDEGDEPYPDLLTRICGSFTELLETLEPVPDLAERRRRRN